jgi:membrane-bound lytic murein transglycosylase MltF
MSWLYLVLQIFLPGSEKYAPIIMEESRRGKIDPLLVSAVIYKESRFQNNKCKRGAHGLMQIQFKSRSCSKPRMTDPRSNIRRGVILLSYWKKWWRRFHKRDDYHWLLHFNQGFGRCRDGTKRCRPRLRKPVTRGRVGGYARRVMRIYRRLKRIKIRVCRPHQA